MNVATYHFSNVIDVRNGDVRGIPLEASVLSLEASVASLSASVSRPVTTTVAATPKSRASFLTAKALVTTSVFSDKPKRRIPCSSSDVNAVTDLAQWPSTVTRINSALFGFNLFNLAHTADARKKKSSDKDSVCVSNFSQKIPLRPTRCGSYFALRPDPFSGSTGAQCCGESVPPAFCEDCLPPQTPPEPSVHFFDPTMASLTFALASFSNRATVFKFESHPTTHPFASSSIPVTPLDLSPL
mmetsp:Transcript_2732/g.10457  ORF Transcript_2732/g.10457 Transcript_2732/m.10457 type:complete len:242 (-) Transcript_2732:1711-2436(-)